MKRWAVVLLVMLSAARVPAGVVSQTVTFYVQLIRGTDGTKASLSDARPADSVLCRRLRMFKWKNYFEIERKTVILTTGGKTRQRMTARRKVEIILNTLRAMTVSIYTDGNVTRRMEQSVDGVFYIAGGDQEKTQSWFIVVRRDKPPSSF